MQRLAQGFKNGSKGCQARPRCHCGPQLVHPCQFGGFVGICLKLQKAAAACTI